jgi:ribonuclease VapC
VIVDTSALVAVLFEEPEAEAFLEVMARAGRPRLSAVCVVELSIVLARRFGSDAGRECDQFLRDSGVVVEPVTLEQARLARQAFIDFGEGRHPAGLNFGDCFSYALAKATGEPLLFKGDDFSRTDMVAAA